MLFSQRFFRDTTKEWHMLIVKVTRWKNINKSVGLYL